jgi:CubicO group peptidase (beta-lactamase class C family)
LEKRFLHLLEFKQKTNHYHQILMFCFCIVSFISNLAFSQNYALENQVFKKKLDSVFQKQQLVGASIVVVKNNQIVYEDYLGKADLGRGIPTTKHTQYRVASISKVVTAIALMQVYEQGFFALDDDIGKHLGYTIRNPKFPNKAITIRQLLSHTSTITDWAVWDSFIGKTFSFPTASFSILFDSTKKGYNKDIFLPQEPEAYFAYCNIAYGMLASLVEKYSKKRFDLYCNENIFKPLGIKASFNTDDLTMNHLAVLYRKYGKQWVAQADNFLGVRPKSRNWGNYQLGTNGLLSGAQGNLRASALDLYKIMSMLMNGGSWEGTQILGENTVAEMLKEHWRYNGTNGYDKELVYQAWGLGIQITTNQLDGVDTVFPEMNLCGHAGDAYGLISDMFFDSKTQSGLIFITNGSGIAFKTKYKNNLFPAEKAIFKIVYESFFKQ